MSEVHWIKLKVDMFDNEKIKLIEAMPDADSILVIWIKLLTYAGKSNSSGYIMLTENIAMNEEELATIFSRPLNTVRYAIQIFERYGMIERHNESIRIKNWDTHQNIEGMEKIREQNRLRKQKQREKQAKKLGAPTVSGSGHGMSRDRHATDTELEKNNYTPEENVVGVVFQSYEELGFGLLNGYKSEQINKWIETFNPEMVTKAMQIASNANKANIGYLNGILNNWKEKGFKSIQDVEAESKQRNNGRRSKSAGTPNPYQHNDDLPF